MGSPRLRHVRTCVRTYRRPSGWEEHRGADASLAGYLVRACQSGRTAAWLSNMPLALISNRLSGGGAPPSPTSADHLIPLPSCWPSQLSHTSTLTYSITQGNQTPRSVRRDNVELVRRVTEKKKRGPFFTSSSRDHFLVDSSPGLGLFLKQLFVQPPCFCPAIFPSYSPSLSAPVGHLVSLSGLRLATLASPRRNTNSTTAGGGAADRREV
jgi:hypothetical protein